MSIHLKVVFVFCFKSFLCCLELVFVCRLPLLDLFPALRVFIPVTLTALPTKSVSLSQDSSVGLIKLMSINAVGFFWIGSKMEPALGNSIVNIILRSSQE